jgi:Domain of unknown function (DUF4436)
MSQHSATLRRRRRYALVLAIGLAAIAASYLLICLLLIRTPPSQELNFEQPEAAGRLLRVYAEVLSVDPVRASLELRLDFATESNPLGARFAGPADRDMVVRVSDGATEQRILLRRGQQMIPASVSLDIGEGTIDNYPFDRYAARLTIAAYEGADLARANVIPLRLTVWDRLAAWDIGVAEARAQADRVGISLDFRVRRPDLHVIFATTLYAVMALMSIIALTAGSLLLLGIRRVETTLAAVLGTMVFSLPALRNVMPGGPPLGVRADSLVFLWSELAVVTGLALVVATWARRG